MTRAYFVRRTKKVSQDIIGRALERISANDLESVFVSTRRAKAKLKRLNPTPRQQRLLRWVWMRSLTFEESIGTHWGVLGPLMTRGYLRFEERENKETGKVESYLVVHDAYLHYVSETFKPPQERVD